MNSGASTDAVQASKAPKRERREGVVCKWCGTFARHKIRAQWSLEGGRVRRKRLCAFCRREFLTDEVTNADVVPGTAE